MNENSINFNEENQDLIDRYLKGELSKQECSKFEQALIDDKELNEQFVYSRLVQEVIYSRSSKLEKISSWDNILLQNKNRSFLDNIRTHRLWSYSWAASILFIFTLGIFGINYIMDTLYQDNDITGSEAITTKRLKPSQASDSDSVVIDSIVNINDSIIYKK